MDSILSAKEEKELEELSNKCLDDILKNAKEGCSFHDVIEYSIKQGILFQLKRSYTRNQMEQSFDAGFQRGVNREFPKFSDWIKYQQNI